MEQGRRHFVRQLRRSAAKGRGGRRYACRGTFRGGESEEPRPTCPAVPARRKPFSLLRIRGKNGSSHGFAGWWADEIHHGADRIPGFLCSSRRSGSRFAAVYPRKPTDDSAVRYGEG